MQTTCPGCGSTRERAAFRARERMHGLPGEWQVMACEGCGLLRLAEPPADLAAYYPSDYYAYAGEDKPMTPAEVRGLRNWQHLYRARFDPAYAPRWRGAILRQLMEQHVRGVALGPGKRLLDVGCGDGEWLRFVQTMGLEVHGVEPGDAGARRARKRGLDVRTGTLLDAKWPDAHFDVVTFNHSFEHVGDPTDTLREARRILKDDGLLVIGVPNADSWSARKFREHWVHLDAPRHLYGWSPRTLGLLAQRNGMRLERVRHIGTPFGIAASMRYRKNDRREKPRLLNDRSGLMWRAPARLALWPFVKLLDRMEQADLVEVWLRKA